MLAGNTVGVQVPLSAPFKINELQGPPENGRLFFGNSSGFVAVFRGYVESEPHERFHCHGFGGGVAGLADLLTPYPFCRRCWWTSWLRPRGTAMRLRRYGDSVKGLQVVQTAAVQTKIGRNPGCTKTRRVAILPQNQSPVESPCEAATSCVGENVNDDIAGGFA